MLGGRFLTEKNINTKAMRSKMADIWKPTMGINIKELEQGVFLFQFYYKEDMDWVFNGGPWTFDNAMLCLETVLKGEDPIKVQLWFLNIWIQIHELPSGFMSEMVGQQLGNFFGEFLLYDAKNNTSIWRECMRVKIRIDVRKPLKRKKRITRKNGQDFVVQCKYERLGDFCFRCGLVTHTERFYRRTIDRREGEGNRDWGTWLRAPSRRGSGQSSSKWLREEGDAEWEERIGRDNRNQRFGGENLGEKDKELIIRRDMRANEKAGVTNSVVAVNQQIQTAKTRGLIISKLNDGSMEDEPIGLDTEGRKRCRTGHETSKTMDADGVLQVTGLTANTCTLLEATLSEANCVANIQTNMAKLAEQASQFQ